MSHKNESFRSFGLKRLFLCAEILSFLVHIAQNGSGKAGKNKNFSSFSNKYCIFGQHSVYFGIVGLYSQTIFPIGEILNE